MNTSLTVLIYNNNIGVRGKSNWRDVKVNTSLTSIFLKIVSDEGGKAIGEALKLDLVDFILVNGDEGKNAIEEASLTKRLIFLPGYR